MKLLDLKCPACGGMIGQTITSRMVTCEYCGSRFALDADEADAFIQDVEAVHEEEEKSTLPMTEFAAQACSEFLDEIGDDHSFRTSPKILRGLGVGSNEDVYLIHDDTLFKSGKNGFAITERGLYCRELAEAAEFFDWIGFAHMKEPESDGSYIKCGRESVCYFTDDNEVIPYLEELYEKLQKHAQKHF